MICFLSCKEVSLFRPLLWGETSIPPAFSNAPCGAEHKSLLAFLERPPWSEKHQDSGSLTWLSPEVRKTLCVREMALRARRRREMTLCVPVERETNPCGLS